MIGTYAAVLAVCGASLAIGQAAIALCGRRQWSWLSPAVGLALLVAICWGTVRLPGHGVISAIVVLALVVASVVYLRGRLEGGGEALRAGRPVALIALLAASLPFAAEGHFGILGTSFNPDMSQHLLAADRLAHGTGSQLLHQGYPLGPHAIVVALNKGLGIGLVQGFSGLTIAVAILAPLTSLAAFSNLRPIPRTAAAFIVGLAYVVASYFAQGAFKETMQALFLLAFVLSLRESTRSWSDLSLRFVPAALLAVGSVYVYSFPGLIWLAPALVLWLLIERALPLRPLLLALLTFIVLVAPEIGRMIDFHSFETFDPNGPGLGNLFGQVSPFEALGIWPSGDFRLAPGDGAVPAIGYHLGAAFALVLFLWGAARCWRRRESALLAGLGAAILAYAAARLAGTPYTAAKAIEIAAPLFTLTILLPLLHKRPSSQMSGGGTVGGPMPEEALATAGHGGSPAVTGPADIWLAAAFVLAAGFCSLLALANAPVGPTSYSPALTGLRPLVAADSTLVLASHGLLANQHGTPYIAWELRGGHVCIEAEDEAGSRLQPGIRFVVTRGTVARPPYPGLRVRRAAPPYVLWESVDPIRGHSPCPLIAVRQARQGPARG
ncbi:MAG TPA: hypothetical protein VHU86_09230 [Solirubrobacterales bacterium]|nr:hypothetical protein [Solirubrobacterales bacterium]